ncbi:MAG: transposase [Deltaproteobacteria bacterium]|nr:transposase [Deltaproteobacteria bacterium]
MRIPRSLILENGSLFHVTWQSHNKSWLLRQMWAKKLYYSLLLRFKEQYDVVFYSYMMMDNHIHLSGKLTDLKSFSAFFRIVNSMFAKEINKQFTRCGQVVRDRFKSPALQTEQDLVKAMIYHDLNEVRAGKVKHPKKNSLSSYAHYAYGREDSLISDPEVYQQMGSSPQERQIVYQGMVEEILSAAPRKKEGSYRNALYIGDPEWVAKQYEKIREFRISLAKIRKLNSRISP